MKIIYAGVLLLWLAWGMEKKEALIIRNKSVDFGIVPEDTLLQARYVFLNTTDSVIAINYVNPECSCTGYRVSDYHIAPHDSIYVDLELNTKGKYGEQKIYTIVCAETETKMYKLTLKANVRQP